jgi:hypothetical protein
MSVKLDPNSNIYKYGSRRKIDYIFTKDNMFGLEVIENSLDSYYLYVNIDMNIDPSSPLAKFIDDGFIVKVGENDDDSEDDLDMPIMLEYQKTPVNSEEIPGGYYKYRFHRALLDLRYDENNKRIPENEDALNENDCLNFGECSTAKHMDLDKNNITTFPYEYETSILEAKENGIPFGISDEKNMELLKSIPSNKKNNYAVPNQGECYAIVRKEYRESVMYHIGFCIYSHNGVNITLEANADNGREYLPAFGFYDTNSNGLTFHKRYISIYDNGETIVLKGRNLNDILKEINEEIEEKNKILQETNKMLEEDKNINIGGKKRRYKRSLSKKKKTIKSNKSKKTKRKSLRKN